MQFKLTGSAHNFMTNFIEIFNHFIRKFWTLYNKNYDKSIENFDHFNRSF